MNEELPGPDPNRGHEPSEQLRRRAERKAARLPREAAEDPLLHELRVHQIELEMQNEELRRAQADLEASRTRYFDLYERASVGFCTLDAAGTVQEANLTAARMLGVGKGLVVGRPLTDFVHRDSQDDFYRRCRAMVGSAAPQAFEIRMTRGESASFAAWVEMHAAALPHGEPACRVAFTDISLLKRMAGDLPPPSV